MKMSLIAIAMLISMLALYGCPEKKGPLESAGEKVDEAVNDAGRAVEDATD